MKIRLPLVVLMCILAIGSGYGQVHEESEEKKTKPFVAFELGEAVFNRFQSVSGEVGLRFTNNQMLRLTHMNVQLTEAHLSSDFAGAVDGKDVEGKFFGFEAFYDFPVFLRGLYVGPSVGYYVNDYRHLILDEELKNNSMTLGLAISYREKDLFGLKGLYFMLSLPMRTHINPIEETKIGSAIIRSTAFDNNIWLFVGYEF